jgi:hypothetical protein
MTKKHFERVARVLAKRVAHAEDLAGQGGHFALMGDTKKGEIWQVANALADSFAEDNERFDKAKFMAACGL